MSRATLCFSMYSEREPHTAAENDDADYGSALRTEREADRRREGPGAEQRLNSRRDARAGRDTQDRVERRDSDLLGRAADISRSGCARVAGDQERLGTAWAIYFWQRGLEIDPLRYRLEAPGEAPKGNPFVEFRIGFHHFAAGLVRDLSEKIIRAAGSEEERTVINGLLARQPTLAIGNLLVIEAKPEWRGEPQLISDREKLQRIIRAHGYEHAYLLRFWEGERPGLRFECVDIPV